MTMGENDLSWQGAEAAYATLRTALAAFGKPPQELTAEESASVQERVSRELAMRDAVLTSEEAASVTVNKGEIDASLQELEERYENREAFLQALARNGLNRQRLREAIAAELKVDAVLAFVDAEAPSVSDDEVRAYYDGHRERFVYPETRDVRHILVTINEEIVDNCRESALKRISQIAWRLKRRPGRFGEQAMKHSECPTALQEGRLGRVPRGKLFPELDAMLFAMQEGEISAPVESELGYHLLYCEKIHPGGEMSFAEAAPRIRNMLEKLSARAYQQAWVAARMRQAPEQPKAAQKNQAADAGVAT